MIIVRHHQVGPVIANVLITREPGMTKGINPEIGVRRILYSSL